MTIFILDELRFGADASAFFLYFFDKFLPPSHRLELSYERAGTLSVLQQGKGVGVCGETGKKGGWGSVLATITGGNVTEKRKENEVPLSFL